MNKIVAAIVGAACGLALAMGGVAWASGAGKPSTPVRADTTPPGGASGGCC